MKRKTRTITVNNKQYIWWHEIEAETTINLSPINDKTSVISIYFPLNTINRQAHTICEYVVVKKGNEEYRLKIISPKMAAFILSNLSLNEFTARHHIYYNGFDLLSVWGFSVLEVIEGLYW